MTDAFTALWVLDMLDTAGFLGGLFFLLMMPVMLFSWLILNDTDTPPSTRGASLITLRASVVLFVISLLAMVLTPSEETIEAQREKLDPNACDVRVDRVVTDYEHKLSVMNKRLKEASDD